MNHHKLELYFFFTILVFILVVSFYIFSPFLYSLILAIIAAIVFNPLYNRIYSAIKPRESLSALLTLFIVLTTVLIPLILIATQIFREAESVYNNLIAGGSGSNSNIQLIIHNINAWLAQNFGLTANPININLDIDTYLKSALSWLFQNVGSLVSSIAGFTVNLFVFFFAFYYLLKDGKRLRKSLISLSPLADKYDEQISSKLELAVNSIIKGSVVVALIQGTMTGIGFLIFGISNPAFWGAIAAIAALIPGLGTALVVVPGIIFLILNGKLIAGIGLLIWGLLAVGLIDNFIGPKLVQRGVQIHSFFILLFALGGLSFFGPLGFLLGPIVLSLLFALIDVYSLISKEEIKA